MQQSDSTSIFPKYEPNPTVVITDGSSVLHRAERWAKSRSLTLVLGAAALAYVVPSLGMAVRHTKLGHVPFTGWSYDALTLALSLIMLSASTQCQPRDFAAVVRSRAKSPFLASVYLIGPLVGFTFGLLASMMLGSEVAGPLSLGLVLLGLMPIAMTSAAWVRMNGGNVPLLLGAIVVTNTVAVPLVPIVLRQIATAGSVDAHVGGAMQMGVVVQQLTLAILIPVMLGISLRTFTPRLVERLRPVISLLGTGALLVSLGSTVSASRPHIEAHMSAVAEAALFTVMLNVVLFFVAVHVIRWLAMDRAEAVTLLFASGMRNMGAAMVVAAIAFPDAPLVAIPAAVFSISQQLLGGVMTSLLASHPGMLDAASVFPAQEAPRPRLSTIPSMPPPA